LYKRSDRKNSFRAYNVLTSNEWSPLIHEYFFDHTKKARPIVYKTAKICPTGNIFLNIKGHCSVCSSTFNGIVQNLPELNTRVLIQCTYSGTFQSCRSRKKRRLIGQNRDEFLEKINEQNISASYSQKLEATRILEYGDQEPAHIPTLNALRVMMYKALQKKSYSSRFNYIFIFA